MDNGPNDEFNRFFDYSSRTQANVPSSTAEELVIFEPLNRVVVEPLINLQDEPMSTIYLRELFYTLIVLVGVVIIMWLVIAREPNYVADMHYTQRELFTKR